MPYQRNSSIPETMPVELDPEYRTKRVNETIRLYEGPMTLDTDGRIEDGTGSVWLDWLPVPRIAFRWRSPPVSMSTQQEFQKMTTEQDELGDASLRLDGGRQVGVEVMRLRTGRTEAVGMLEKFGFVHRSEFGG